MVTIWLAGELDVLRPDFSVAVTALLGCEDTPEINSEISSHTKLESC